jgi:hypothetical protein
MEKKSHKHAQRRTFRFFFGTNTTMLKYLRRPFYHSLPLLLPLHFESLHRKTPHAISLRHAYAILKRKPKREKKQENKSPYHPPFPLNLRSPRLINPRPLILRHRRPQTVPTRRLRQPPQAINRILELVPGLLPERFPAAAFEYQRTTSRRLRGRRVLLCQLFRAL